MTRSLVASLITAGNSRVQGTAKFWDNPAGAEAILQVRAAVRSDEGRLAEPMRHRPGSAVRRHNKRKRRPAA